MKSEKYEIDMEARLYQDIHPEGYQLELVLDTHNFVSWPNADVEKFIETCAASEEREARNIHIRNRIEGGVLTLLGVIMISEGVRGFVETRNPMYLLGGVGGVAGVGFGIHVPHNKMSLETQKDYKDMASAMRNMSREIRE